MLKAEGIDLTPEDVIRLNALAIKAHNVSDTAINVHVQRAAFLPKKHWWNRRVVLRELTVAHWLWLEQVGELFQMGNLRAAYVLYAYAMSLDANNLPDPFKVELVKKNIDKFAKANLYWLTDRQLFGAVDYCLVGADWKANESAPEKANKEVDDVDDADIEVAPSPMLSIITVGRAYGIGLSADDLKHLLPSEVEEAITMAQLRAGLIERDGAKARAVAAYVRAREEIRNRNKVEEKEEQK